MPFPKLEQTPPVTTMNFAWLERPPLLPPVEGCGCDGVFLDAIIRRKPGKFRGKPVSIILVEMAKTRKNIREYIYY